MEGSWGRPSPAAGAPWKLRTATTSAEAAVRADGGDLRGWALRAASVSGVRHRIGGQGNDDAFAWSAGADGGGLVVAVADGVGSVAGSARSAARAVEAAVGGDDVVGAIAAAAEAVEATEGATTLVVAALLPDGKVTAARIGDSSAFVLGRAGWSELFGVEGEDIELTTAALPSAAVAPHTETVTVDLVEGEALVLVTDGLANPLRDGPETVAPSLAEALAHPPAPVSLTALIDFSRRGCHDDRTLLGVWRLPPPASE